jgi:hypothetical protein
VSLQIDREECVTNVSLGESAAETAPKKKCLYRIPPARSAITNPKASAPPARKGGKL